MTNENTCPIRAEFAEAILESQAELTSPQIGDDRLHTAQGSLQPGIEKRDQCATKTTPQVRPADAADNLTAEHSSGDAAAAGGVLGSSSAAPAVIVHVCAWCKNVLHDVTLKAGAPIVQSHGICSDCYLKLKIK